MRLLRWLLELGLVGQLGASTAGRDVLHVHPAGDDNNKGTEASPVRTPTAARDLLRKRSGSGPKEVVLHAGTYPPLQLSASDSGTKENPVRWTGLPGSVLSGGVPLPASLWKPRSAGDKVMVADLNTVPGVPEGLGAIEHGSGVRGCLNDRAELFLDAHRMVLARFPNLNVNNGSIDWHLTWLRANGNFDTHGAGAYCAGEDPKNVTGCLLLPAKVLASSVDQVLALSHGPCVNISGDWSDPYHFGEQLHIVQDGCRLAVTATPVAQWHTAHGIINDNKITMHFANITLAGVVFEDRATDVRSIEWTNHGVWKQGGKPCPLKPCASHPGRTYCPSNSSAGQCNDPPSPAPSCKPCSATPMAARAAEWAAQGTGWIHAYLLFDWADTYNRIASVESSELRYDPPDQTRNNARFAAVNLYSELDAPGEYFLDDESRLLYFFPPSDEPLSQTNLPVLSNNLTALDLRGARHITITGLQILHARGSGVLAMDVNGVVIQNCTIAGHALDGITMVGTDSAVLDSVVHDCGCAGIRAHGGNDRTLSPGNLRILRNDVTNVAQWKRTYSPGIHWGGVNNTYSHNTVHNLPHNGFLGGGNEVKQVHPGGATLPKFPNGSSNWGHWPAIATANNTFDFNVIDSCGFECDDTGAFYTCGQQATAFINVGNKLRHSTFINIRPQGQEGVSGDNSNAQAIYLDDEMSNWEIMNNTIINCNRGIAISGKYNKILNNSFVRVDMPISGGTRGSENTNCSACHPAPPLDRVITSTKNPPCINRHPSAPFMMQCVPEGVSYLLQGPGGAAWLKQFPLMRNLSLPQSSEPSNNVFEGNTWCGAIKGRGNPTGGFSSWPDAQWEAYGSAMIDNHEVQCPPR